MVLSTKIIIPIVIGASLCGASAILLYLLLKKEDDVRTNDEANSKFVKRSKTIPVDIVSAIIGRGGSKIKELEQISGARILVTDYSENPDSKLCVLQGNPTAVELADGLIEEIIEQQKSIEKTSISVPHWTVGKIIGKGGENIDNISLTSGAKVKIEDNNFMTNTTTSRSITITGLPEQIKMATLLINKLVEESKQRRETEGRRREPRGKHGSTNKEEVEPNLGTKGSCPQNAPPAGSSGALLEVFVTAISSPSRFWLQIAGPQVEELDKLVDLMTEYYNNSDNRLLHKITEVKVGQIVAAVFRHDGKWYRAKVVEIKPNEFDERQKVCDLYFVDYGDNEYVAIEELYSLRTDMLKLRFQAVECFLAGVGPISSDDSNENHSSSWNHTAIERFEELTQVARWKRLWSRTCTFKERPKSEIIDNADVVNNKRNIREGSPVPGVKLYDTKEGVDLNIGQVLIDEGWAIEKVDEEYKSPPPSIPTSPPASLPPTFGDLECSRVLGMVVGNREERAASLPHGSSSPSTSPNFSSNNYDDSSAKSLSLAAGIDNNVNKTPPVAQNPIELSYPKPETNGVHHMNGSATKSAPKAHQNGDFLNAERGNSSTREVTPKETKPVDVSQKPFHVPDPKDELKAKINRVESHHGSLEAMGKQAPPLSIVNPPSTLTHETQSINKNI